MSKPISEMTPGEIVRIREYNRQKKAESRTRKSADGFCSACEFRPVKTDRASTNGKPAKKYATCQHCIDKASAYSADTDYVHLRSQTVRRAGERIITPEGGTLKEVAEATGCDKAYVKAVLMRHGIWPRTAT